MNRIFHERITWAQVVFILIGAAVVFWAFWIKQVLLGVVFLLMLIVMIERAIHTTYTLTTDGRLLVYYGRFTKGKEILVSDIKKVEKFKNWLTHGVVVHYGDGRFVPLQPVNEEELIASLQKG
ncbi:MAG: PH domain-containing protein [Bacteroidaceae bacterium]|nr:PH domain-containing protein [Bacteroidaceae bacterium]